MKNFFAYYLYKASFDLMLIYPLYVLLFQNRGQNEAAIGWLLALWSLSVIVLELPMGVLSDKTSRKKILIASSLSKACAFALWIPARSFLVFAAGFALWGLSEALSSGTEEAWLYETLHMNGRKGEYQKIKGRGRVFSSVAIGASSVLGGLAVAIGETFVLTLSVAACIIAAGSVFFFDNPPRAANPDEEEGNDAPAETSGMAGFLHMARAAFSDIIRTRTLLVLTLFASFVLLIAGVLEEWDPIFLTSIGITPAALGVWLAARYGFESLGALAANRADRLMKGEKTLLAVAAAAALVLPAMALLRNFFILPLYGFFYATYSMLSVQVEGRMQNLIHGGRRATVMSVRSLLDNSVAIAFILGTGYLAEAYGWKVVLVAGGTFAVSVCAALFLTGTRTSVR